VIVRWPVEHSIPIALGGTRASTSRPAVVAGRLAASRVEVDVSQLNNFVSTHLGVIGVVIVVGCVVLVLMILMLFIQSRRIALLSERLDDLTQGADGQSLEGVLATHLDTVIRVGHDLDEVIARTAILEGGARLHFGRLGIVRFNPFDDTGGNQSFALAILDANNDGFVITSLHSRTGTRVYAKAVFDGQSETTLVPRKPRRWRLLSPRAGKRQRLARPRPPLPVDPPARRPVGPSSRPPRWRGQTEPPGKAGRGRCRAVGDAGPSAAASAAPAVVSTSETEPAATETGSAAPTA